MKESLKNVFEEITRKSGELRKIQLQTFETKGRKTGHKQKTMGEKKKDTVERKSGKKYPMTCPKDNAD